ncbi:MAG: hypothetical protein VB035_09960 [Candidatus Fimivivens sp.]|nr:hypothetical protein [Candidatus Fimivivens sp.]
MPFTKKDFLSSAKPYADLAALRDNPQQHDALLEATKQNAYEVGVSNFLRIYDLYLTNL